MRKQAKKCVGLLLALSLILSCVQIAPVLSEVNAAEESSMNTANMDATKTWDFSNDEQIDDFDLDKQCPSNTSVNRAEKHFEITNDGYLCAAVETVNSSNSPGNAFRKAILKEDVAVKSVSVDIQPAGDTGNMSGGIFVGYADEVTPNGMWRADECVFIYLRDAVATTNSLYLNIYRGTPSTGTNESVALISETNINASNPLYTNKDAQKVRLMVEIEGSMLTVTVSSLAGESEPYSVTVDVTTKNSYDSNILVGRVGLGAHGYGAKFDDLTVEYTEARTWDFNNSVEVNDFELDKIWSSTNAAIATKENFKSENGYFSASTEYYNGSVKNGMTKKAILKDKSPFVKSVSVDIYPENTTKMFNGGIYVGYADEITQNAGWRDDNCVYVYLKDTTSSNKLEFFVTRGTKSGQTILTSVSNLNESNKFYSGAAQPLHLTLEIEGPYLTVTVSLLSNKTINHEVTIDVRDKEFTSEILQGRVGLGAFGEGAKFDNFTINGDQFAVGGISDSQIAVSKYGTFPTGADIVDGKYILGWTKNGEAITKYETTDGNYEANVVDPAMLGLSSQTAAFTTKTGRYDVRFIGSLNEFFNSDTNAYENYKRAGFVFTLDSNYATSDKLVVGDKNCVTKTTYNLYSGLNETVNSTTETRTPADIYGSNYAKYFFAYEITGVSIAEGKSSRTIYARAYLELENGDIVYGEPSSVTVGDTSKQMDVYLIAGQSNAAGRSAFTTASLNEQNTAYVNGFSNVLYSGAAYNKTAGNLVTLQSVKAGFGAPDDNGNIIDTMGPEVGMADAFSASYNETSGKTAGIVKLGACAVSLVNDVTSGKNAHLGNWVSPSYEAYLKHQGTLTNESLTGGMYTMFVEQAIASLQQIREAGYEPNIKGIYWMQGENDREDCQEYVQAFRYFATDIRNDLSTLAGQDLSNMPIVIGEISRTFNSAAEQTKNETFIAMQNTLPNFVSNCYIADISDYDVNEMQEDVSVVVGTDRGHYNEADCLAIGKLVGSLMMEKAGILAE